MIRLTLLTLFIAAIAIYAWRDWYVAACGLVLAVAVIQHPDFPKTIGGIQGLNLWNLAALSVVSAWAVKRGGEGLRWDIPRHVGILLCAYLGVVLVGWLRMMADPAYLFEDRGELFPAMTRAYLVSEFLVNTLKWVIPGMLLFDGCRTRERFLLGLAAVLGAYVALGAQVIKWMPPSTVLEGDSLSARSLKILTKEVGFHRVNLSMMLGGASWAIFASATLPARRLHRVLIVLIGLAMVYAQALTGGRTGYGTWGVVGLVMCLARWRKSLLLMPIAIVVATVVVPGAFERISQGFEGPKVDEYAVTAGRNIAWPLVIDKIYDSPLVGYGRQAMIRTGLAGKLWDDQGEAFPHPHNAFLEMLLDNGVVGFLLVMPFYVVVLAHALSLFRDRRDPLFVAVGGTTCALVLALLVASMGSQTFYPREGAVPMWAAIALMLRAVVVRAHGRVEPAMAVAPLWPGEHDRKWWQWPADAGHGARGRSAGR